MNTRGSDFVEIHYANLRWIFAKTFVTFLRCKIYLFKLSKCDRYLLKLCKCDRRLVKLSSCYRHAALRILAHFLNCL